MTDEPTVQEASGAETAGETVNPEPTTTEPTVETTESDQPVEKTEETSEVKSERGQKRVQQLANKASDAEHQVVQTKKENDTLKDELSKITQPQPSPVRTSQALPWNTQPVQQAPLGETVTQDEYRAHVEAEAAKKADTIVDLKIRQFEQGQQIKTNYEDDISSLETEYSDAFSSNDPELKTEFKRQFDLYRKTLQVDPNVRFKDFAGPLLKARSIGVEKGKDDAVATISQQASETAVKPSSEKSDPKTTEDQLIEMMKKGEITAEDAEKRIAKLQ